jgi:hypothetical protein
MSNYLNCLQIVNNMTILAILAQISDLLDEQHYFNVYAVNHEGIGLTR